MKAFYHTLILVLLCIFIGCNKIQEPLLYTEVTPFGDEHEKLGNDISRNKNELPKNIKKIIQYKGDTVINFIEYDTKGNEVFKLYKQYVDEFWPGKYITMVMGNVFEDGQLLRTYYFHSNMGFSLYSYQYGIFGSQINMKNIYVKDLKGEDYPINTNPFRKIDTLRSLTDLLNNNMTNSLDTLTVRSYTLLRHNSMWSSEIEKEAISSNEGRTTSINYYDDQHRLIKSEWPSGSLNLYKYGRYGLREHYRIGDKKDTTRIEKISYNKEGLIDTLHVDDWRCIYQYKNKKPVVESVFNSWICIQINYTQYDSLGYQTLVRETDCSGKTTKEDAYHYVVEYYK